MGVILGKCDGQETNKDMASVPNFREYTTLRLGGAIHHLHRLKTQKEVHEYLTETKDSAFILGGGSNIVVSDNPITQPVLQLINNDVEIKVSPQGQSYACIGAGAVLDEVITELIAAGYGGVEFLSGIPGSAGGAIVQNVGAYGVEISQIVKRVYIFDRKSQQQYWRDVTELNYRYRNSLLKNSSQFLVYALEIWLQNNHQSLPVQFAELAKLMGIPLGTRVNAEEARAVVLSLRKSKGMVHDIADYDTWSVGSFFVNPVVSQEFYEQLQAKIPQVIPHFSNALGEEKIPAAWLIEQAGFVKGYPGDLAAIRLSTKHTLALTNRGTGTTKELMQLAKTIRSEVLQKFGIELIPEPVFVGFSWHDE